MAVKILKIASIIIVGLVGVLIVLLISLIYFSPYENCLRSNRAENKGEAWAVQTCQWNHYLMGEPPQSSIKKIYPTKLRGNPKPKTK